MERPDRRINVDTQSLNYKLGAIFTRVDAHNEHIVELTRVITTLATKVDSLPCTDHNFRINGLEKRKANCTEAEQWESRNRLTFKQKVITVIIGAIIGGGATAIIMLLM